MAKSSGRFGKYGDLKRKQNLRKNRLLPAEQAQSNPPEGVAKRWRDAKKQESGKQDPTYSQSSVCRNLRLIVDAESISSFFSFLQCGFEVGITTGCTLRHLLVDQLQLDPTYVSSRISTIFLDGKPVDDMEGAIVRDGSRLALSAAMPGLVGATMRRGGSLASFRSSISYKVSDERIALSKGSIQVKLFNLVMSELGPIFMERGIIVKGSQLFDFFGDQPDFVTERIKEAALDGKPLKANSLAQEMPTLQSESICLQVWPSTQSD